MRNWTYSAAALVVLALSVPARAEPIGATLRVVNQVTAQFNRDTRTLIEGDGVSRDEVIAVASDALSELVFKDQTKLALGPGSQVKLDKFVYDASKSSGDIAVNLLKGTFRFITGLASKPTYVIRTPAASITVRGTIFDVYVFADGATWLLLHEGAIAVRNQQGACKLLDTPGRLMRVTADGSVGAPVDWNGLPGNSAVSFDKAFPFVANPPSMDPRPAFTRAAILAGPPANPASTQDCDESKEEPKKATPQRADDDDNQPARKPVRHVEDYDEKPVKKTVKRVRQEDYDEPVYKKKPPPKVVIYDKPKKHKRPREQYDDNDKAKAALGLAIIGIGAAAAIGGHHGHHGGGDYGHGDGGYKGGGGYGGMPK